MSTVCVYRRVFEEEEKDAEIVRKDERTQKLELRVVELEEAMTLKVVPRRQLKVDYGLTGYIFLSLLHQLRSELLKKKSDTKSRVNA